VEHYELIRRKVVIPIVKRIQKGGEKALSLRKISLDFTEPEWYLSITFALATICLSCRV